MTTNFPFKDTPAYQNPSLLSTYLITTKELVNKGTSRLHTTQTSQKHTTIEKAYAIQHCQLLFW